MQGAIYPIDAIVDEDVLPSVKNTKIRVGARLRKLGLEVTRFSTKKTETTYDHSAVILLIVADHGPRTQLRCLRSCMASFPARG